MSQKQKWKRFILTAFLKHHSPSIIHWHVVSHISVSMMQTFISKNSHSSIPAREKYNKTIKLCGVTRWAIQLFCSGCHDNTELHPRHNNSQSECRGNREEDLSSQTQAQHNTLLVTNVIWELDKNKLHSLSL